MKRLRSAKPQVTDKTEKKVADAKDEKTQPPAPVDNDEFTKAPLGAILFSLKQIHDEHIRSLSAKNRNFLVISFLLFGTFDYF